MPRYDLKLLDCTLRDGGYINGWKWGFQTARNIIRELVNARVDIVEVGFLRDVDGYAPDVTACNTVGELNRLLPEERGRTMFSAMAMRSNFDIRKLTPFSGQGIEIIRTTAHDYDIAEGMEFAREVKDKGYKLSINPINIMGYSDEKILWLLEQANRIQPWQFCIVDTFGSMKRRDLERIVSLADHNLDRNIRVALHLHENMSLSCALAQNFIEQRLNRPVAVDASLMGIGRIPGNLPIELIADYLNDALGRAYDIDPMMDAIEDYIAPMKGCPAWGYTPAYFLSARFNLHRNYAEYYLKKGDLTNRDINHILARFDREKRTAFDEGYAGRLYEEYKSNRVDDSRDRERLRGEIAGRPVLLLAPGATLVSHEADVKRYIERERPVTVAVNFIPERFPVDYAFFSNNKRFSRIAAFPCRVIAASNLTEREADYRIDYNSISGDFSEGCNSLLMLLKLLRELGVGRVALAGADGYSEEGENYCDGSLRSSVRRDNSFNAAVAAAMRGMGVALDFITPSRYVLD